MIAEALALLIQVAVPGVSAAPCPDDANSGSHHKVDVCADWIEGTAAYSASWSGSLIPRPASQQVMIFQTKDGWRMRIAGYRWDADTGTTVTQRRELSVPDEDVQPILEAVNASSLQELSKLPYYGADNVICTDGANYEVVMAKDKMRQSASRHSCADPSALDAVMGVFRSVALKQDPSFEGLLFGLNRAEK